MLIPELWETKIHICCPNVREDVNFQNSDPPEASAAQNPLLEWAHESPWALGALLRCGSGSGAAAAAVRYGFGRTAKYFEQKVCEEDEDHISGPSAWWPMGPKGLYWVPQISGG